MTTTTATQLSKWWQTESCARAYARVSEAKRKRIEKLVAEMAARKAQEQREFDACCAAQ
jgi:hypothetical protein